MLRGQRCHRPEVELDRVSELGHGNNEQENFLSDVSQSAMLTKTGTTLQAPDISPSFPVSTVVMYNSRKSGHMRLAQSAYISHLPRRVLFLFLQIALYTKQHAQQ